MVTGLPEDLVDPAPPHLVESSPHQWPTDRLEKAEEAKLKLNPLLVCPGVIPRGNATAQLGLN
jgi:hypothetical protein